MESLSESLDRIGHSTKHKIPQKNKFIDDDGLKAKFHEFETGGFKISDVGNLESLEREMEKFNNEFFKDRFDLDQKYRDKCIHEMNIILCTYLYKEGEVTSEELVAGFNRNGDGGFRNPLTKGDMFICQYDKILDYMKHPLLYLSHFTPIWTVSQKCEVRDDSKDPRLYQFPEAWFYFCGASLFLRQNKTMQERWGLYPFAPGFSPEFDADKFMNRLTDNNPKQVIKVLTLDWEKFDKGIIKENLRIHRQVRKTWDYMVNRDIYRLEAMDLYYEHLTRRVCILPDGSMYLVRDGNPSGHNNTTPDNNLEQLKRLCVIHEVYKERYPKEEISKITFTEFLDRIKFISFGDDGLAVMTHEEDEHFFEVLGDLARETTGRELRIEMNSLADFIFLGRKYFQVGGFWFSYGADVNKAVYGLIHKLERKNIANIDIQNTRVFGQWQLYMNLHLHPNKREVPQYKYLLLLEELIHYKIDADSFSDDLRKSYGTQRAAVFSFLMGKRLY